LFLRPWNLTKEHFVFHNELRLKKCNPRLVMNHQMLLSVYPIHECSSTSKHIQNSDAKCMEVPQRTNTDPTSSCKRRRSFGTPGWMNEILWMDEILWNYPSRDTNYLVDGWNNLMKIIWLTMCLL
jgi:hypothetical protein